MPRVSPPFLPIIYVRGYAATMAEIEATTADPYMGFNLGASHLRQRWDGKPVRFIFESPLLRLIKDHDYVDAYQGGGIDYEPGTAPPRSVWVFRYYEQVSESLGTGRRVGMEQFAADLRAFILQVRRAICGDDAAAARDFQVALVAHSMGGLVCRSYLQNLCRHGTGDTARDKALELDSAAARARHHVGRFYTYGTPHGGIEMLGMNVPDFGGLDGLQVSNFNRGRMREYLKLPAGAPVNSLDGAFPVEHTFCFIGSNHRDYEAFAGLSKKAAGPMSDGLVAIADASIEGAPRAIAHRSHSGPYGIVNSEEGYQNLRRFLFGEVGITARLAVDALSLPAAVQAEKDAGKEVRGSYYIDAASSVRNALYMLNERRQDQNSAILMEYDALVKDGKPVYLFTGYLLKAAREAADRALVFYIDLAVHVPLFEVGGRLFRRNYMNSYNYRERITFAIRDGSVRYGLASLHGDEAPLAASLQQGDGGTRLLQIALASPDGVRPGFAGRLLLEVAERAS
ncbi:hypothetical protein [Xanthomonas sp. XNM01]|uniref:esterase/lipase family protein n=1 Tax=Xanthomonas sp. XNM01 TaxID=2769289 RepID=UPI0017845AB9|nr:hypothetical protein [Xanthomonas sp. XNM01]MBD9368067.1 hypothetical protein [Xanthomonas sp. XNM01]